MTADHAEQLVARLLGYWPSPPITDEEALIWANELTDPELDLTYSEVAAAIRRCSYAGERHRPRPGAVVAAVRAERRALRRLDDTKALVAAGSDGAASPARALEWLRACRRMVKGDARLDEVQRELAEGRRG